MTARRHPRTLVEAFPRDAWRRLIAAAPLLLAALQAVRDELTDRADVYDGNDGRQMPNEAMSLQMELGDQIDAAIAAATKGEGT
jgi:hypothetical protein